MQVPLPRGTLCGRQVGGMEKANMNENGTGQGKGPMEVMDNTALGFGDGMGDG